MIRQSRRDIISSLAFNGTNGRLQLQSSGAGVMPAPFLTVSAWIKTPGPAVGGTAMVIFARDDNSTGLLWNLSVSGAGKITFKARNSVGTSATATGATTVTDNKWHFVMGTWDGTTLTVFLDGASDGTQSLSGVALNTSTGAYPALGIRTGTSEWYNGLITKASVFNTPFTLEMHQNMYFRVFKYSDHIVWQHDDSRDLITAATSVVHDITNVHAGNSINTVTRSTDVPEQSFRKNVSVTKRLVSASAKGATMFNTASYTDNYLVTFNGNQYIVFADSSLNVMVGKRVTGASSWTIVDTGFNIGTDDDHNVAAIGIDPDGYIHLAYDHHGTALNYARSNNPEDISAFTSQTMTGDEAGVSYPKFFNANGYMFFSYRGYAGPTGNQQELNRYDPNTETWTHVATLVDGSMYALGGVYSDGFTVDDNGTIHHTFCWRTTTSPAITYDNFTYMYSTDNGATWKNSAGQQYTLPITPAQGGDIISGTIPLFWPHNHIAFDGQGRPHVAYNKAGARVARENTWHAYLDNGTWHHTQVTDWGNTINSLQTFGNYDYARPNIVVDKANNRVFIIVRVGQNDYLRLYTSGAPYTSFESYRLGDPAETYGRIETGGIDYNLWNLSKQLHITAQQSSSANPDNLYVLEVDLSTINPRPIATGRVAA